MYYICLLFMSRFLINKNINLELLNYNKIINKSINNSNISKFDNSTYINDISNLNDINKTNVDNNIIINHNKKELLNKLNDCNICIFYKLDLINSTNSIKLFDLNAGKLYNDWNL